MGAFSPIGFNSGIGYGNQFGNLYSNNSLFYNPVQNINSLNPAFNSGFGIYGNNFGFGMAGASALGIGGGFNSTGFLISALLIPAITMFISEIFQGISSMRNNEDGDNCSCFKNSTSHYDRSSASENFDNSFDL
jgi:hypothetical protein